MSTTIYQGGDFGVARIASDCDRCSRARCRCVQFVAVCSDAYGAHTHTLCLDCFDALCLAVENEEELPPLC